MDLRMYIFLSGLLRPFKRRCLPLGGGLCSLLLFAACDKADPRSGAVDSFRVPDGFTVEEVAPAGMVRYPMFATYDQEGRLFVIESSGHTTSTEDVLQHPTFLIRLLEDEDDDGNFEKAVVFADSLPYPMGGVFYQGSFYTAAPPDLLRLTDSDGDGIADKREVMLTGWTLNHNAATLSGPFLGPDGWMYLCDARRGFDITTKEGERLQGKTARIWRCQPDGTGLESVSGGGFDNTIELVFMPGGETIGTMTYFTDPQDGFRDALMHWVEGGVYPKRHPGTVQDQLKLTGEFMPVMTKLARVSHSGLMRYRSSVFGDAYAGNLFTAEFNTGRVMRHIIAADGATFRTETEPFMTSTKADVHPTDVLEDADGSLLVVNTGGWFIAGCPLSVVAKADVHGGIFRIRKASSPEIEDPWGKRIDFQNLSDDKLVAFTDDPRPAVRDHAFEELIARGDSSIPRFTAILRTTEDEAKRAAAVFALYRVGTAAGISGFVKALDDKSAIVRTAACRVAGLAGAHEAVDRLLEMLRDDEPQVRRQAATALGQIGDKRATGALLAAAATTKDRFVEHAIIYAVIGMGKTGALVNALRDPSEGTRRAALIALDQIDEKILERDHLKPFLESESQPLRAAAIWVLAHHPGWGDLVVDFIRTYFNRREQSADDGKLVADLMISFTGDQAVQQFVINRLRGKNVPANDKLMLLEVMASSPAKDFPSLWVDVLGELLQQNNPEIRATVLDMIGSRRIRGFDAVLAQIIQRHETPAALKLKALAAKIGSTPHLSASEFEALLQYLKHGQESTMRHSAVRLLAEAELNENQLLTLGRNHIGAADVYLLSGLISAFEGSRSEDVGLALASALRSLPVDRLENLSLSELERVFTSFPVSVRDAAEPLLDQLRRRQSERYAELLSLESQLEDGDVGVGRELFYGKALCSTCHAIAGNGGNFGPDLTNIGEIRSQHDILEAIVYPAASFAREYETSKVVTDAATYTGIVTEQLPETLVLASGPGVISRIPSSEIKRIEQQDLSLMPRGLQKQLTLAELGDLMTYLKSLPDGMGHLKHVRNTK